MNLQESARPAKAGKCLADELLIVCARTHLDPTHVEQLRRLAGSELDWSYLLAAAHRHGMLPLVSRHLNEQCPETVPLSWRDYLRVFVEKNVRENFLLTSELLRIAARFARDGVLAFSYKGPTLAADAFGSVALRQMVDLDLLTPHHDLLRAHDSLVALGYETSLREEDVPRGRTRRAPGQYAFTLEKSKCLVELHTERTLRYFPRPLDPARLASRSKLQRLGGQSVRVLAPEDQLLFLCVHGAKHFWDRLSMICDVAEFLRAHPDLDWDQARREADALGAGRILRLGLLLAVEMLRAEVPYEILLEAWGDAPVAFLLAQVRETLFVDGFISHGVRGRLRFRMGMVRNIWAGIRYSLRLATTPAEENSGGSGLLRSALRPGKLIQEYGWGLRQFVAPPDLAPYLPTPIGIVERMLGLAEVGPSDVVYDLGCGDGRIVIQAAKKHGARGVGVELHPGRIAGARKRARKEGVEKQVTFLQQDAKTVDISPATVVTLYLTTSGNIKLRQILQSQLRPGTRIVSYGEDLGDWVPEKTVLIEDAKGNSGTLHLWRVASPATSHQA